MTCSRVIVGLLAVCGGVLASAPAAFPAAPIYVQREAIASPALKQELAALRAVIATRKLKFHVGNTGVSEKDLKSLCGEVPQANIRQIGLQQTRIGEQLLKLDEDARSEFLKTHPNVLPNLKRTPKATMKSWDWRTVGKVTPVRAQGCGDCWAYGTVSALESSYLIRNGMTTSQSEYYLVTNAGAGNCSGGYSDLANAFLVHHGTTALASDPDPGVDGPAASGLATPYLGVATGFVDPSVDIPTVTQLKQALCKHGPLSICVYVTPAFKHYTDGVFNEFADGKINHCVTLIGWDDNKQAWLIKNSWGTDWGDTCGYGTERGYMWIAYGSNRIGQAAQWILAKPAHYTINPKLFQDLILQYKVIPHLPPPR